MKINNEAFTIEDPSIKDFYNEGLFNEARSMKDFYNEKMIVMKARSIKHLQCKMISSGPFCHVTSRS